MALAGIACTELLIRDEQPWAVCLADLGYRAAGQTVTGPDRSTIACGRGPSTVLLSRADPGSTGAEWISQHGEGIADLAFATPGAAGAFSKAIAGGVEPLHVRAGVAAWSRQAGSVAAIAGGVPGTSWIRHSLWQAGPWHLRPVSQRAAVAGGPDHLDEAAAFYRDAFQLHVELRSGHGIVLAGSAITLILTAASGGEPRDRPGAAPAWWLPQVIPRRPGDAVPWN